MGKLRPRKSPCPSCPFRRDVPSGIWDRSQYELLRAYDGSMAEQAAANAQKVFLCHQGDDSLCSGWAGCFDMSDSFAARLHAVELDDSVWEYQSPVPLFASGAEAADHGERDIECPSAEARRAVEKIVRVRDARGSRVRMGDGDASFPVVCANGCPGGSVGRHKFSCSLARGKNSYGLGSSQP